MLITDREQLKNFTAGHRLWQGIPSIERTKAGRVFLTFYSGGVKEEIGNYSMLVVSEDGVHFSEPVAVAYQEQYRCFDPCLWIDPLGRLWFTWAEMPDHSVHAVICSQPDADQLVWGAEFVIGCDVMMNKPIVLSTGEWLFPIAVWDKNVRALSEEYDSKQADKRPFVYRSCDHGKSFEKIGGADIPSRSYDEHMLLELKDGRLAMFVRTTYGIGVSYSADRGRTWTQGVDSGLGGPSSRFHIRRLSSGRILLINHVHFTGRNNLTALLSDDEGKTWSHQLLLDERDGVSYPDAALGDDGFIYITYDRERGAFLHSLQEVYASAREILVARITERDILSGRLVDPGSRLKCIASKLGRFSNEDEVTFS